MLHREIAGPVCPSKPLLEACEPYLCSGRTSDFFCIDFLFLVMFTDCEATGSDTIACNEAEEIMMNESPDGTTEFDGETVPFMCAF